MRLSLKSEDQILDIEVRKKIIEEIRGSENRARKDEAFKRYQCYKDLTYLYVQSMLTKQFDANTVKEMNYALSNIGVTRKVIDKLARVYKYGVTREVVDNEPATEALQVAVKESDVDKIFKKTNRYLKLQKNCVQYLVPTPYDLAGEKKTIKPTVLLPYLYDAVELDEDRERPICFILSDYQPYTQGANGELVAMASPTPEKHGPGVVQLPVRGNKTDETIADSPLDQERFGGFVFWTENYHFTCNAKGEIVSGPDILNPIKAMPFINYAEDQDGSFWAIGGSDLVDGAILVNSLITNINHIAVTQGYGQPMWTGKKAPRNVKVGPNKVIIGEYETGDPEPKFSFINSNPPLDQLRSLVEMYVALLLSTNNLSTAGVSSNLNGGVAFPSGIAMMIDKAESMEDVEDQRQVFVDNEPLFWDIYARWHRVLKSQGVLSEELSVIDFPEDIEISVQWQKPKPIETDKERLEVMKLKKELGLATKLDMLRSEFPNMSDEELKKKLEEILTEAAEDIARAQEQMANTGEVNGDEGSKDDEVSNSVGAGDKRPGFGKERSGRVSGGADPFKRSKKEKPNNG